MALQSMSNTEPGTKRIWLTRTEQTHLSIVIGYLIVRGGREGHLNTVSCTRLLQVDCSTFFYTVAMYVKTTRYTVQWPRYSTITDCFVHYLQTRIYSQVTDQEAAYWKPQITRVTLDIWQRCRYNKVTDTLPVRQLFLTIKKTHMKMSYFKLLVSTIMSRKSFILNVCK